MTAATSSYIPPPIVTNIAIGDKPPYQYISRRFGRGQNLDSFGYLIEFHPVSGSNIRRYSFITKDYVIGTMRYDMNTQYTSLTNQNRVHASLVRLMVHANEFDIEGIHATTNSDGQVRPCPEIIRNVINLYG